jgi:hypothetical protein
MADTNDSTSTSGESLQPSSQLEATSPASPSPRFTPEDDDDISRCIQDVDPSCATRVSHIGDCNLECCYCAVRWSARRVLHLKEN